MEFRNHQAWVQRRLQTLSANPLAALVAIALFVVLLLPLLAIGVVVAALVVLGMTARLALRQLLRGREGSRAPLASPHDDARRAPPVRGPVIDVEVTRSEPR